jgi:hypothetical protein
MNNHREEQMSEKRENFALMCVLLFSFFLGFLAYLGAAGKPWLNDGWDEPLAVGVGLAVTVLAFRGVFGFLQDYDEHNRRRVEERERWARRSQDDAKTTRGE